MKKIVMTGGGTAGHVTPNIALMPQLRNLGYKIYYIGSYNGIEKDLITAEGDIEYFGISSGKLRRYHDLKNFSDPIKVIKGFDEAKKILKQIKPDIVFSKGGYVSVPVIVAARVLGIPSIIHESDLTPGLANKIAIPNASYVCCNFPETLEYLPDGKKKLTGSPIRTELLEGSKEEALQFLDFNINKPIILVMGGSTGSVFVNNAVRDSLNTLLKEYQVVHLCGKGKCDKKYDNIEGYRQFEYINEELPDLFAAADIVVSRAGANSIFELLALNKPNILIPLSTSASRGDQLLNAESFEKQGFSVVLEEEEINSESFIATVRDVYSRRVDISEAMKKSGQMDSITSIINLIEEVAAKKRR